MGLIRNRTERYPEGMLRVALLGDPTRAETELGWRRTVSFTELVAEMAQHDLVLAERDSHMQARGYRTASQHE